MGDRAHLSIGEVLSLVQDEFPDVTISKIRFLESQGLLDPERTPSGYRKFYETDIDRLQWILTQQRDNFLPLKVIRDRLDEWDATGTRPSGAAQTPSPEDLPVGEGEANEPETDRPAPDDEHDDRDVRRAAADLAASSAEAVATPTPEPQVEPVREPDPVPEAVAAEPPPAAPATRPEDAAMTADELAAQAGVSVEVVRQLESFSMIESRRVGPDTYYDPEHLRVVAACRAFVDAGIEVRHLRMYKIAAEREAGVFEQLVMPLLKQRNPEARARAVRTVDELAEVGEELHAALLRAALRSTLP